MNLREIDMMLDSLNIGRDYIEEALQKEEAEFEGYIHLSRYNLTEIDLMDINNTIKWLKSRREKLEQGSI